MWLVATSHNTQCNYSSPFVCMVSCGLMITAQFVISIFPSLWEPGCVSDCGGGLLKEQVDVPQEFQAPFFVLIFTHKQNNKLVVITHRWDSVQPRSLYPQLRLDHSPTTTPTTNKNVSGVERNYSGSGVHLSSVFIQNMTHSSDLCIKFWAFLSMLSTIPPPPHKEKKKSQLMHTNK